ncbi:hypothetical protein [Streptomyces sp. NPDC012888]|uniref:hypothetical protein n=1 Tax=Streptomyces sp. NPDC012888 TaxID=3364855 RepID=UPI00368DAD38
MSANPRPRRTPYPLAVVLAVLALLAAVPAHARPAADGRAQAELSLKEAAKGTEVTVTGTGWPAGTVVMLLLCGQNMIGGTNSCANDAGRAVSVAADGRFRGALAIVAPPRPCPCVVNVTSVNGDGSTLGLPVRITDHPVAELPAESGQARLAVLTGVRLEGEDGVLTWFGAPPSRRFTVTVGNMGSAPVKDPVFQIGTAHGVFAPLWEEHRWKGTIPPGQKAEVALDVTLGAGDHGDYTVSLKYGDKVLAAQPWGVGRPYGVLLFWGLLLAVVPAGAFRIGMAVVDRVRPRTAAGTTTGGRARGPALPGRPARPGRHRAPVPPAAPAAASAATAPDPGQPAETATAVLPWFTPDGVPGEHRAPQTSAPSEHRSTTKGNP